MTQHLLDGLNPVQQDIVKDTEGQLLVLAGAGSGKTRVLTHRIAYLLLQGVPPWQILAVTFTNKAAREMRERIVKLAGTDARDVWMGTFHGICIRILARFGHEIGLEKFTIIDDTDQKKILKDALQLIGGEFELDTIKSIISDAKNNLLTPSELLQNASYQHEKEIAHIYQAYEDKKTECGYIDFDDCIMKVVHLFNVHPESRDLYQRQFRYVLTDETQDTNKAQFKLLTQLSGHHENIFVVGDADQSIYKFRGADISNIMNFNRYFPETKLYKLEQNYRSTATIVSASNSLIGNNKERLDKTAFTDKGLGNPIVVYQPDDDGREADFVAQVIKRMVRVEGRKLSDFAVLYRLSRQSRAVETAFNQNGVQYEIVGGTNFYDRKEIKDLVCYLRVLNNQLDLLAFKRIINVPKRGVGDTSVGRIDDYANECGIPFSKALENLDDIPKISKKANASIKEFLEMMKRLESFSNSEDFTAAELIKLILRETKYKELLNPDKDEDATRLENIEELINVAGKWDEDEENKDKDLIDFLNETALVSSLDGLEASEKVTLMTTHSSKGLEFKVVFILGVEEGIFPHGRSMSNPADMEEERRLMYVAMTRAEEKLFMTHCTQRYEYGKPRPIYNRPSRFLKEIPEELVQKI